MRVCSSLLIIGGLYKLFMQGGGCTKVLIYCNDYIKYNKDKTNTYP